MHNVVRIGMRRVARRVLPKGYVVFCALRVRYHVACVLLHVAAYVPMNVQYDVVCYICCCYELPRAITNDAQSDLQQYPCRLTIASKYASTTNSTRS